MKKVSLIVFGAVVIAILVMEMTGNMAFYHIAKPMIMISLAVYYLSATSKGERSPILLLALLFSWLGDSFLMYKGDLYFMLGLSSFLISHIFYVFTYRQHKTEEGAGFHGVQKARYAFPIILAGTGLLTILFPVLGPMKVPVTIYALVLVLMALAALFRFGYTTTTSFWWVLMGAILFMVSDSTLAINKFLQPVPMGGLMVMSTYMAAQFMIVHGLLKHKAD